jgi:hypothetical protein
MKRPQFGLRLMLLVVALAASILGWRTAVEESRRIDQRAKIDWEIHMLKLQRVACERRIDDYQELMQDKRVGDLSFFVKNYQAAIVRTDKRIEELSK